jgi:hypothetical protein
MDMRPIFTYFGLPTLFIMLCMTVVAWLRYVGDKKSIYKLYKWVTAWAVLGCFLAISLAAAAWIMNTDFVYNHANLIWPFCLSLAALNGRPPVGVGLLVVGLMGVINGVYCAALAALTWKLVRLLSNNQALN